MNKVELGRLSELLSGECDERSATNKVEGEVELRGKWNIVR